MVTDPGNARRQSGGHVGADHGTQLGVGQKHGQGTVAAMLFAGAPGKAFGPAEGGEQAFIGPARCASDVCPEAKIFGGSAHVGHGVQTTGTADDPTAGPIVRAPGRSRLRHRAVGPVIGAAREQRPSLRNSDIRIGRGPSRFDYAYLNVGVFAQARGQDATC